MILPNQNIKNEKFRPANIWQEKYTQNVKDNNGDNIT